MPWSQVTKDKHHTFFDKMLEKFMPPSTRPPTIPPYRPANGQESQAEVNRLAATLGKLYVSSGSTQNREQTRPVFVGGFNLAGTFPDPTKDLPLDSEPPAMPVPQQSLTMTYALQQVHDQSVASSSPPVTPQKFPRRRTPSRPNATTASPSPAKVYSCPVTPVKHTLPAGSSPSQASTSSHQPGLVPCSGITKAQKPCARMVKTNYLIGDTSHQIEHFCYQHAAEVLKPSGYYISHNSIWVDFDPWIRPYLQESTRATLRAEMAKAKSAQDEPGYIYTFEIRDPGSRTIRLKVGRATNVVKRLDQWTKQCSSEEQVPRGVYPGNGEQDGSSLMKGRIQAGEKAPFCHRLERLIHIELADLVSTCVYLEPGWPNIETPPSTSASPKKKANGKGNACNVVCPDCGIRHSEIFEFRRWEKGEYQGKEWERIVKPVIERWGKFVELYV